MKRAALIAVMALAVVAVVVTYALVRAQVERTTDGTARELEQWRTTLPARVRLEIVCEDSGQTSEYCEEWAAMLVDQHTEMVMTCWDENAEDLSGFRDCVTDAGLVP